MVFMNSWHVKINKSTKNHSIRRGIVKATRETVSGYKVLKPKAHEAQALAVRRRPDHLWIARTVWLPLKMPLSGFNATAHRTPCVERHWNKILIECCKKKTFRKGIKMKTYQKNVSGHDCRSNWTVCWCKVPFLMNVFVRIDDIPSEACNGASSKHINPMQLCIAVSSDFLLKANQNY